MNCLELPFVVEREAEPLLLRLVRRELELELEFGSEVGSSSSVEYSYASAADSALSSSRSVDIAVEKRRVKGVGSVRATRLLHSP